MSDQAAKQLPSIDLDDFERRLRHAPQTSGREDPLSELARLVAKDDPFKAIFDDLPAARGARPATSMPAPPVDLNVTAHPHDAHTRDDGASAREPHAEDAYFSRPAEFASTDGTLESPDPAFDQAMAEGRFSTENGIAETAARTHDDRLLAYGAQRSGLARMPRKAMIAGLSLSVVAIAGVAAAIGFRGLPSTHAPGDMPVIRAAAGPVKVQPPKSETAEADATPTVLDKGQPSDGPANSKVVSREEQPADLLPTVKTVKTQRVADVNAAPGGSASSAPLLPLSGSAPEPKRVKTVLVRPDGSIIGEPPARPAAPTSASGQTPAPKVAETKALAPKLAEPKAADASKTAPAQASATTPVAAKATTRVTAVPAKPQQVADAQAAGAGPLQIAPAHPKAAKVASHEAAATPADDAVQTTGSTGGAFSVQLAAPPTEQEAKDTSARLQKQFAGTLGSLQPSIRKAADKPVYRVRVGNLSKDEADALCGKLKAAGGNCFVARN